MSLSGELDRALGGRVGGSLADRLSALKQEYGTVTAAAKAAGIDRRTFQRYESGKIANPKPATAARLDQAVRAARVEKASLSDASIRVTTTEPLTGRQRTLGVNLQLAAGTIDRVKAVYAKTGNADLAAVAFLNGIGVDEYRKLMVPTEWDNELRSLVYEGDGIDDDYHMTVVSIS